MILNYEFTKELRNIKYKECIVKANTCTGWKDIYLKFLSHINIIKNIMFHLILLIII